MTTDAPPAPIEVSPDISKASLEDLIEEWVVSNVPEQWRRAVASGDIQALRKVRSAADYEEWYPRLGRSGLAVPAWRREYGGLGLNHDLAAVVSRSLSRHHLAILNVLGVSLAGPTILECASERQKLELLPKIPTNEHVWCQLWSEPGAGSDLASLATRAERDGSDWILNGQKVWSTFAHVATHGMLLARTDPDLPKHRGITYFALDMTAPGVEVRPLRKLNGDAEFNEVFLSDVRVPDSARIGPVNEGWRVAMSTLRAERQMLSGSGSGTRERTSGRSPERLIEAAKAFRADGRRPADDPSIRYRLIDVWVESRLLQWTNQRARDLRKAGIGGAEASIRKLFQSEHNQRVQNLAVDILGMKALAIEEGDRDAAAAAYGFLRSRGDTIAGGTSEIQRNTLGERVLGLPREPSIDRAVPWSEVPRS